ncbi:MAG: hypothetical protein JRJ68_02980 [Deltaproteobacteria bacterium]|nr:hypothetical protein [Deltaproteobacteria bacterium]
MQCVSLLFKVMIVIFLLVSSAYAADKQFDSEQMLSDLESKLKFTSEQLSSLKPAIDEKSAGLKKSMHESIDKGFIHLDELAGKLDTVTRDAEKKAEEFLSSEDMKKFKEYLNKIDEKAIKEMKDKAVAEFSAVLDLTKEQVKKLKPVLEESLTELADIFAGLAAEGNQSWEGLKQKYEKFSEELKGKLQDTLDDRQMEELKKYNEEQKEKIQEALYSV